ncbi:MAG: DUF2147 domain-containing protein [Chitinophagales bacterium]|nr:DUF2147 domain-containing protein [Chitinophagales bacterium]
MKRIIALNTALAVAFVLFISAVPTEKNPIERIWYNQEKTSKIQIYLAKDGNFYGKVIWLDEPNDKKTGKPRTDKENPDAKLRDTPLEGLLVLKGFKVNPENPKEYIGGKVYDPENGKTYCGKITHKGNTLDLRGFLCAASFLGRTAVWTLAE